MTKKKTNKTNSLATGKRALKWAVDYDYTAELSPKDLEWLRQFTRDHYDNGQAGERRRANYRNSIDLMTVGAPTGALTEEMLDSQGADSSPDKGD